MHDITVVVTTFNRPSDLRRCLLSIRRYYPDIKIVVADDGDSDRYPVLDIVRQMKGIDYMLLPFDSGLSMKRNEALDYGIKTKYAVICDDDFEFTERTRLEDLKTVLDGDKSVGVAAGSLVYDGKVRYYGNRLEVDWDNKFYQIIPITKPEWREVGGVRYYYADYTFNFFMMRNVPELRWDNDLKIAIEHIAFFLEMKKIKWRVANLHDVTAVHHYSRSPEYDRYRMRYNYWKLFYKKTGLRHGVNTADYQVFDLRRCKMLPYPEYVFKLIELMNRNKGVMPKGKSTTPQIIN